MVFADPRFYFLPFFFFLLFMSGMVSGSLFPTFHEPAVPYTPQDRSFWQELLPNKSVDYAKLFLWSFIAGFAERLVPDMIDNLLQGAAKAQSKSAPMESTTVLRSKKDVEVQKPDTDEERSDRNRQN
jgi:hypothetical protein